MSFNKVLLLGNLGKDPELVQGTATPICKFPIATSERRKDQSGNWGDHTEWHNIITFGNTAENCSKYLKKGKQVLIDGKISTRKWQDKEGKDRYTTEIIANTVQFVGTKNDMGTSPGGPSNYPTAEESPAASVMASLKSANAVGNGGDITFEDDDIPF